MGERRPDDRVDGPDGVAAPDGGAGAANPTTDGRGGTAKAMPTNPTAAALIEAGRELFAEHGYDGASVRAITTRAGANLGAITYHFESKRALYEAVLESCLAPFAETVVSAAERSGTALDRIESVVRAYFAFLADNPDLPKFMMRELVAGRAPPRAATSKMKRVAGAIAAVVAEGQADGSIREGDPALMALSIISQPIYLTIARPAVRVATGLDQADPATHGRIVDHAVGFVRAGLTANPE